MTATCTLPIRIADLTIGAIVETHVSGSSPCGKAVIAARKSPVLLLFAREGDVLGLDLAGNRLSRAEIEDRYPGRLKEFLPGVG
jgi:hypothetical protein